MNSTLLKRYGKILLVILLLGAGTYFGVDTSKLVDVFSSQPAQTAPDAGQ